MRDYSFPPDHRPGMKVPHGGSSCARCEYLRPGNKCGNDFFIEWHGSAKIPAPASEYCSDWFEPRRSKYRVHQSHQNNLMNDRHVNGEI